MNNIIKFPSCTRQLSQARNIAEGWQKLMEREPRTLEEAKDLLKHSAIFAGDIHAILTDELKERK
ncbi:hypothetical protein [[Erwinia] mediterraneensis]|uniref:hypothetical protein n=1 Tax=[Erwinia] mediterraneensis TaxID=2161819 RepID=UPI00102F80AD|nr:hypothetical protein [[Erwinia] mediterraneensis]